jgi:GNAT superfamily N-acetyltransferase
MNEYWVSLENAPSRADVQLLEDRIIEYNVTQTGRDDGQELAIFLRDESNQIVAGIHGWTWAGWLELRYLWVQPELRGMGRGRQLLLAAEQEAVARGCEQVLLDTFSFQAPDFYRKLGYEVFGTLEGFPRAHQRYFLTKRLRRS